MRIRRPQNRMTAQSQNDRAVLDDPEVANDAGFFKGLSYPRITSSGGGTASCIDTSAGSISSKRSRRGDARLRRVRLKIFVRVSILAGDNLDDRWGTT